MRLTKTPIEKWETAMNRKKIYGVITICVIAAIVVFYWFKYVANKNYNASLNYKYASVIVSSFITCLVIAFIRDIFVIFLLPAIFNALNLDIDVPSTESATYVFLVWPFVLADEFMKISEAKAWVELRDQKIKNGKKKGEC